MIHNILHWTVEKPMLVRLVIHKVIPVDLMGKCARPLAHMVTAKGRKSSAVSNIMGYSRKNPHSP